MSIEHGRLATRRLAALALGLFAWLFLAPHADGQGVINCSSLPDRTKRNTYLDDVQFSGGTLDAMFAKFLRKTIRADLNAFQSDDDSTALIQDVLVCKNRRPKDRSSFPKDVQTRLYENSVLFEIWVIIHEAEEDDADSSAQADIFVASPLCQVSSDLTTEAVKRKKATIQFVSGVIKLSVDTRALIQGYAELGACILAIGSGDYPQAFKMLNQADCLMRRTMGGEGADLMKKMRSVLVKAAKPHLPEAVIIQFNTAAECR